MSRAISPIAISAWSGTGCCGSEMRPGSWTPSFRPAVITALLGGELEGGWKIRWRLKLFFLLVKLQARFGLLPPVSFAPLEEPQAEPPAGAAQKPAETEAMV